MKYKVGDKVVIQSKAWYNANKQKCDIVWVGSYFTPFMSAHCGKTAIIKMANEVNGHYRLDIDNGEYSWSDEMIDHAKTDLLQPFHVKPLMWSDLQNDVITSFHEFIKRYYQKHPIIDDLDPDDPSKITQITDDNCLTIKNLDV